VNTKTRKNDLRAHLQWHRLGAGRAGPALNSQRRTRRELASGRSRPPGAAPPGGGARER